MQVNIAAHLLCKWGIKMRGNCFVRCQVYFISKYLIRLAQRSTHATHFIEIPWSNPLKHANHLVHWNTLPFHHSFGFYSMKQTMSTIYPHPKPYKNNNNNNTCRSTKTPQKLNWFQRGSLAGRQSATSPRLPFFLFFAMQHLKYLNGISLAIWWLPTLCAGWDRVCPCLVPPSSSFALIHFLRFGKNISKKNSQIYKTKQLMRCCYYRLNMRRSRNFVRRSPIKPWHKGSEESKYHQKRPIPHGWVKSS